MPDYVNLCIWPDGSWCELSELEQWLMPPCARSDDYFTAAMPTTIEFDHVEDYVQAQLEARAIA